MEEQKPNKELKPLSASRIKTFENCSWLYHCQYIQKLPQKPNDATSKGTIVHLILENLLHEKRKNLVRRILKNNSIEECASINRLIRKHIKKLKIKDVDAAFEHINTMILVGLKTDFYIKGGRLIAPEYKFDIVSKTPEFRIKGFIDKLSIKGETIYIDDYKTSKKKFEGEDEESNLQAMCYSLAARRVYPDLKPVVRFIFLQFPDDPIMQVEFNDDTLIGLEYYLESIQKRIDNFNQYIARSHFAADENPPSTGEFKGKLLCGYSKYSGHAKKTGEIYWHCSYKHPFDYYSIKKEDKVVYNVLEEDEIRPLKEGEKVEKCHYPGCPRHVSIDNATNKTTIKTKKPVCVFDDF